MLNNLYTFYQLECVGKKYGAGLLKIQRYDIENLYFPNINVFSGDDYKELKKLGKKLAKSGDRKVIDSITHVLANYSDISYERISAEYNYIVKNRLENV